MKLAANITIGWVDSSNSPFCAWDLHSRAAAAPDYERSLFHQLQLVKTSTHIARLDRLFRRTSGGFTPVLRFVEALASMPDIPHAAVPLLCDIDLFAYAFLAGTRNLELLLPLVESNSLALAQILNDCQEAMRSLERFERTGVLPTYMSELDTQQYLALRHVITQPNARKELQVLAALLVSGPSTASNLTRELALSQKTTRHILELLESIEIVNRWHSAQKEVAAEPVFSISKVAIPLVMFGLKEKLGLDLMGDLLALVDANYG